MATNKKSGWTEEERTRYLHDHGFVQVRQGKGSHTMWEHAELKELSKTHKIKAPENILATEGQKPWDLLMCDNPASGTWHSVQKQVEWCNKTIETIREKEQAQVRYHDLKAAWRLARREICTWKKDQKHWLKAGLALSEAPLAPESYHQYEKILAAVQPVFTKTRDPFLNKKR
jgi:hypothetical protein